MSQSSNATPEKEQIKMKSSHNSTDDQEKEQLKNEISRLKESLSQNDSFRERAINAEAKISSLQKSIDDLLQQINNLTLQNTKLLKEIASLNNQKVINPSNGEPKNESISNNTTSKEKQNRSNDIQKLQNTILTMQEKFQQELAFRDDLISRLRSSIHVEDDSTEKGKSSPKQKFKKQKLTKKQIDAMRQFIIIESDDTSTQTSDSQTEKQLFEQKYLKKKNELILLKQQYEELKDDSNNQIKKTKENLDEVRQKFHLLKKKYVDLKEDFSSLQVCYQAVVQKAETLSSELQKTKHPLKNHNDDNDFPKITIKTHECNNNNKIINQEEKNKYKEMKKRAQKAEKETAELRCFLQILAKNEKNFDNLNLKNQDIINQLNQLGIKIDRLENRDDKNQFQKVKKNDFNVDPYTSHRKNKNKNDYKDRKIINDYQEPYQQQRMQINDYQYEYFNQNKNDDDVYKVYFSPKRNKNKNVSRKDSYSPQRARKKDFQDSISSLSNRSKSVKKEPQNLPQWRKFKDF